MRHFGANQCGRGTDGIAAFIVEKGPPGFQPGEKESRLGLRASDTATVTFSDYRIPKENLLGEEGAGFRDAMGILDGGRIGIAPRTLGMATGAYEAAHNYVRKWRQFGGRSPNSRRSASSSLIWLRNWMPPGC